MREVLLPGCVIGDKYEILFAVGEGGMARVYAARHRALGHLVALKIANAAEPGLVCRFTEEARATARMESEHVARVTDVGQTDAGSPWMAMDFLEGTDLARLLAESGPLSIDRAVRYVLQACEALAEAHALGIIHRDLKPENIFLATRKIGPPIVKVLDFGIAKSSGETEPSTRTAPQILLGTPDYMSPEQIRTPHAVDARTDIWSLGVVLFELLTGTVPFTGQTTSALLAAILSDAPRSLRALRPDVPEEFERVVQRCLEKSPEQRFASIGDLCEALAAFAPEAASESMPRIRLGDAPSPQVPANDTTTGGVARSVPPTTPTHRWPIAAALAVAAAGLAVAMLARPRGGGTAVLPENCSRLVEPRGVLVALHAAAPRSSGSAHPVPSSPAAYRPTSTRSPPPSANSSAARGSLAIGIHLPKKR